jgi:hypothetical protein
VAFFQNYFKQGFFSAMKRGTDVIAQRFKEPELCL